MSDTMSDFDYSVEFANIQRVIHGISEPFKSELAEVAVELQIKIEEDLKKSLDGYQEEVRQTFKHDNKPTLANRDVILSKENLFVILLGLAGEAGEVVEIFKKAIRRNIPLTDKERAELKLELGDVLWHVAAIASFLDFTLEDIAAANIQKLEQRNATDYFRTTGIGKNNTSETP